LRVRYQKPFLVWRAVQRLNRLSDLFRPREYCRPESIEEAISLLARYGERARPIAGGTDLLVEKPSKVEYLIDIMRLPLAYIRENPHTRGIGIGALTTVREIETSRLFEDARFRVYSILADVAKEIGYVTTRNLATIGGNICNAVPSADFPPVLIAMDAEARIVGPNGERILPLEGFFVQARKTIMRSDELLTEIQVPRQPPLTGVAFSKLGRLRVDIALVNVAARVTLGPDESCKDARIVLGAVAPTPIRAKRAENLLKDRTVGDDIIEEAAQAASEETKPISDVRASAEYRRMMSKVLTTHVLKQALERAGRG